MRSSAAIDRAALLGTGAAIVRAADPEASLARLDEALSALEDRALVLPSEKDGLPAFRISADGFIELLAACARPPRELTPATLLVRFNVLARAILIEQGRGSIDPFALGIPFELPTRTGVEALPSGILDRFGGSFEDFARFFHGSFDRSVLLRWKGALRCHRASLLAESARLLDESARIDRGALADEGTRSKLVHQIEIARSPSEPVEVRWVERAFLDRQTLVLPALAMAEALLAAIDRLEAILVPPETAREGELAPDFAAASSRGQVALSALRGRWVVLYFYPVDDTPGCTLEACRFRDLRGVFEEAGATVLGVSTQDAASHRAFSAKHGLDFELVADPDARIARAYGVFDERHGWADRVTFLIDPAGRIARIFKVAKIEEHAGEVLAALRRK